LLNPKTEKLRLFAANNPPNITVLDGGPIVGGCLRARINETISFTVTASDQDGDTITFHLSDSNAVSGATINKSM